MTYPKLKPGELVDIVAPSYGKNISIEAVAQAITGFGLTPRFPDNMMVSGADPFCANIDEIRLEQLENAIFLSDSKVIWAFRGGYGAARLIPGLLELPCPAEPKILIGFSDITVLHIFFTQYMIGLLFMVARQANLLIVILLKMK